MNAHQRITLDDSLLSAMMKLGEGNPGAITALMTMAKESPAIDPEAAFGPYAPLFSLDVMGIYGSNIWVLWKYVCNESTLNISTLFRSVQMGLMRDSEVIAAANGGKVTFDFPALLVVLQAALPSFGVSGHPVGAPA